MYAKTALSQLIVFVIKAESFSRQPIDEMATIAGKLEGCRQGFSLGLSRLCCWKREGKGLGCKEGHSGINFQLVFRMFWLGLHRRMKAPDIFSWPAAMMFHNWGFLFPPLPMTFPFLTGSKASMEEFHKSCHQDFLQTKCNTLPENVPSST